MTDGSSQPRRHSTDDGVSKSRRHDLSLVDRLIQAHEDYVESMLVSQPPDQTVVVTSSDAVLLYDGNKLVKYCSIGIFVSYIDISLYL